MFESGKALIPRGLELLEPRFDVGDGFSTQMENANAGIGSDTLVRREAGLEQNLKMFARLRWGRFGRRGEFTRAVRPFAEEFDHPSPSRIGKCDEGLIDGGGKVHVDDASFEK